MTVSLRRHITPDDRAASPYLELPFDVGPGTESVEVRVAYDRSAGVVDLGCAGAHPFAAGQGARGHLS